MTLYLNGREALESPYILGTVVMNGGIIRPSADSTAAIRVQNAAGSATWARYDTSAGQLHLNDTGQGTVLGFDTSGTARWHTGMDTALSDFVVAYHATTDGGGTGDVIRLGENWAVCIGASTPTASPAQLAIVNHNDYDTRPVLLVQGGDGQTGNLLTIQDSAPAAHFVITSGGACIIHDTANTKNVRGLTVNQIDADDEIASFKSSDVAHGFTGTESDTFGRMAKADVGAGGLSIVGYSETGLALALQGAATTENSTKTTAGRAHVEVVSYTKNSTGAAVTPSADANVFAVRPGGAASALILDQEGDLWLSGAATVMADHAGITSGVTFTAITDLTANSSGVGTILFKGGTARNSAGFLKVMVGTTPYYCPLFAAITS